MTKSSSFNKDAQQLLRGLKKQLSTTNTPVLKQPVKAAEPEPLDDTKLFQQAMHGVKPLSEQDNIAPARNKPKKPDAQTLAKRAAAVGGDDLGVNEISDTQAMLNPVASEAILSYRLATLQHRVFEQLKTGKLRWYEAVDLHGCTIEQARDAVLQVIEMARKENQTVVKIVHGKGPQAILKTYVNGWLRQHPEVLAFVSAPPDQGGTGAVLVLIKRSEKHNQDEKGSAFSGKRSGR